MENVWSQGKIQSYISNQIQESLTLDYKAADALMKTDNKKKEITKDVSAMANSAGGILIYGIREYIEAGKEHLPEKLDPVNQSEIPKEWIEQVISTIHPKIEGIIITPVPIDNSGNLVVYIVEIPQGKTAYQAADKRYYKRYNFLSSPMDDYEIKDVIGRNQCPRIKVGLSLKIKDPIATPAIPTKNTLHITVSNVGSIYAKYVNAIFQIPRLMLVDSSIINDIGIGYTFEGKDGTYYLNYYEDNAAREKNELKIHLDEKILNSTMLSYIPLLPGRSLTWKIKFIDNTIYKEMAFGKKIAWTVYADNSMPVSDEILFSKIERIGYNER
jgi:hypothetical protein